MISSPISRCALNCAFVPTRMISSILSRGMLQCSRFSTHNPNSVYQTKKEDESFEKYREKAVAEPVHFQQKGSTAPEERTLATIDAASEMDENYVLPHPCWSRKEAENVTITHRKPEGKISVLDKCKKVMSKTTENVTITHRKSQGKIPVLDKCNKGDA